MAILAVALVLAMTLGSLQASAVAPGRTYTVNDDFDEGTLVGVEHTTVPDQLQLSDELVTLPFIWVPNMNGTVSKVDTETGDELGRYIVAPYSTASASRTTVDLNGNCWVGNRNAGTVVKIGLFEAGQYIDRNGNGTIETSQDLDNNGNIDATEILPWGQDECVLFEVVLIPGKEGTYVPGTYPSSGYEYADWGQASPRGLAIDASNNLWAGTWNSQTYYYIDGSTGVITRSVDVSSLNHHAYGAVIDGNGILWSSGQAYNHVLRLDPSTDAISTLPIVWPPPFSHISHFVYGLGIDQLGHLFISGWDQSRLSRVDVTTGVQEWDKSGPYQGRGVACTSDNDVWVASTADDKVYRYDNDGNLIIGITVGNGPTGVAVDAAGKVWACNLNDETIVRIDPVTNLVDLTKTILGSGGHYSYSDMTGIVARTVTTKLGTWTVRHDGGIADTPWGTVSWGSSVPAGTSISVQVRSSNDQATWSGWESVTNGVPLSSTPAGQYLEIEATLQITSGEVSPILYDLTVMPANQPPVADAGGPYPVPEGGSVTLDGSGSSDPDGDPLTYAWDLDGNSTYETPGQSPVFSAVGLDGPSTVTVGLQVCDTSSACASDTAQVDIANVAPSVGPIAGPAVPVAVGTPVPMSAGFTDPGTPDTHTASWNWGDGTEPGTVTQGAGFGSVADSHAYSTAGIYTVELAVTDDDGGIGQSTFRYVVVYDPSGGFVTGGGWIDSPAGAYIPDDTLAGRANFGFVSKYKKGATTPTGQTEFQFKLADLNFHSSSYDWLVIAGAKAMYKGTGTINGAGNYGFMLSAIDAKLTPSTDVDRFRIRIWDKDAGDALVYDNQVGEGDNHADPTTDIAGGQIVIHKK
jgi:streptogramin lyase